MTTPGRTTSAVLGLCALCTLTTGARAQRAPESERPFAFAYGLALGSSFGLYSDQVGLTAQRARTSLRVGVSHTAALLVDGSTRFGNVADPLTAVLHLRVSGLDQRRFYGLGNHTAGDRPGAYYGVEQYRSSVDAALDWRPRRGGWRFTIGPTAELVTTDADIDEGIRHVIGDPMPVWLQNRTTLDVEDVGLVQLTRPYGVGRYGQLGAMASIESPLFANQAGGSLHGEIDIEAHPAFLDVRTPYARAQASLAARQSFDIPGTPTVSLRAGATRVWGDAPYFALAYLGGRSSFRGARKHRFAGDASVYSQLEVRLRVGTIRMFDGVTVGVLGLADVGRVHTPAAPVRSWHYAQGGGIWFQRGDGPPFAISAAHGPEGTRLYVAVGWP